VTASSSGESSANPIEAREPARRRLLPSRGSIPLAISAIYFADATLASAFVVRWCAAKAEVVDGTYLVRDNEPTARIGAGLHETP
jgi:hypothetical protein